MGWKLWRYSGRGKIFLEGEMTTSLYADKNDLQKRKEW